MNQQGDIQAIGGVNEKIEGYFGVCRIQGLTGSQGVMIPASNVEDLMLREDILDAVAAGKELPYVWNAGHQARVDLLPRDGSAGVRWIDVDPCWVFHCLNAYDADNGQVVVDLCQYTDSFDPSTTPRTVSNN